jgi:hypothetical protein
MVDIRILEARKNHERQRLGDRKVGSILCAGCEGSFKLRDGDWDKHAFMCLGCKGILYDWDGQPDETGGARSKIHRGGYPPLRGPNSSGNPATQRRRAVNDKDIAPDAIPARIPWLVNPFLSKDRDMAPEWNFPRSSSVRTTPMQYPVSSRETQRILRCLFNEGQICPTQPHCSVCGKDRYYNLECPELWSRTEGGKIVSKILKDITDEIEG